jgi:hypothetical protein
MDNNDPAFAPCPTCGNDDVDTLVWDDPDGDPISSPALPVGPATTP